MKVCLLIACCMLHGCTVFFQPDHGGRTGKGHHGGVVIEIPQKTPDITPMPN